MNDNKTDGGGMTEIISSIIEALKTRITNPFLGTLAVIWMSFHWKMIYFLLSSDKKASSKIAFIDNYYSTGGTWPFGLNFWLPLIIAFLYVWKLPALTAFIQKIQKDDVKKSLDLKAEKEAAWERATLKQKLLLVEDQSTLLKKTHDNYIRERENEEFREDLDANKRDEETEPEPETEPSSLSDEELLEIINSEPEIEPSSNNAKDIILNPHHVDKFKRHYNLQDMKVPRLTDLIDHLHIFANFNVSKPETNSTIVKKYIKVVERCDDWSDSFEDHSYLDFSDIDNIFSFYTDNTFPVSDSDWERFLILAEGAYTKSNMSKAMDAIARFDQTLIPN